VIKAKYTLILFYLIFCFGIFSQTVLDSLDSISSYAEKNSLEVRNSDLAQQTSYNNIKSILKIDSAKLSTSSTYNYQTGELGFNSQINIPIIDQLSVTGSLNNKSEGSLGININPLIHSAEREISLLNYNLSQINTEKIKFNSKKNAIQSTLNWMFGFRNLKLKEKRVDMYKNIYEDNKNRYEKGTISLDELQKSLIDWSDSRKALLDQKQNYYNLESNMYSKLGSSKDSVKILPLETFILSEAIEELDNTIISSNIIFNNDPSYREAVISNMIKKVQYDNIWLYDPDLTLNSSIPYNENGIKGDKITTSLNFSIKIGDFKSQEKEKANQEYSISMQDLELKENEASLGLERIKDIAESSHIESEIFKYEYEQALVLLNEAEILHKAGDYSQIELLESQLFLQQAENNYFSSLVNEYLALFDYLKYIE